MIFPGIVGLAFPSPRRLAAVHERPGRRLCDRCLRTAAWVSCFTHGLVLTQPQRRGRYGPPTVTNLFVFWLWEIPLAWWLSSHAGPGSRGVPGTDDCLPTPRRRAHSAQAGKWKKMAI
jgi:hypothetical protein